MSKHFVFRIGANKADMVSKGESNFPKQKASLEVFLTTTEEKNNVVWNIHWPMAYAYELLIFGLPYI